MWKRVLFFLLPILVAAPGGPIFSQSSTEFNRYVSLYSSADGRNVSDLGHVTKFVGKLEDQRRTARNDHQFLAQVFAKTHQRFLKNFEQYATFSEMIGQGKYNCLTGTAFYALLLNHFGYEYEVIETNYHIFLLANTSQGKVLIEATDPAHGFVDDKKQIEKRIDTYKQNTVEPQLAGKANYRYTLDLYNAVTLDQLLGLLHYNLAIEAYNTRDYMQTVAELDKATALYPSPRLEEFSKVLLLSVIESKLATTDKENCVRKIQSVRRRMMPAIAMAN